MTAPDRLTLGFDSSAAHCAAALVSGGRILAHRVEPMARGQAERLMPLLEDILAEADAAWADLRAIGVGTGPGNFTGTRIAVAAARGLALSLGIPAEGVSLPDAYGQDHAVVCLPAPRGQVHMAWRGAIRTRTPTDFPPDWPRTITGPAADAVAHETPARLEESPALAPAIARIAATRAAPGRPRPAPIYLRPADAAPPADPLPSILR
ncbi:MAG: tRNA (adenosine(37)-N6)-threonylcarbamoyltransferase complex dimerization subunit type 1 TsaB [Pseudomonadota bacterium]